MSCLYPSLYDGLDGNFDVETFLDDGRMSGVILLVFVGELFRTLSRL